MILLGGALALSAAVVGWFQLRGFAPLPLLWLLLTIPTTVFAAFSAGIISVGNGVLVPAAALVVGTVLAVILALRGAQNAPDPEIRVRAAADADLARRAAEIARWEEAYALAHNGERPPAGYQPPVAISGERTNNLALAAFVVALIQGGPVAIVLGHVALGQIRRSGESGRGFAITGLVIGYLTTAIILGALVTNFAIFTVLLS